MLGNLHQYDQHHVMLMPESNFSSLLTLSSKALKTFTTWQHEPNFEAVSELLDSILARKESDTWQNEPNHDDFSVKKNILPQILYTCLASACAY
jgi:hypothetical protein